jgi:hypothetical protein
VRDGAAASFLPRASAGDEEGTMMKAISILILCVVVVAAILEVKLTAEQHRRLTRESHAATS